MRIYRRVWLILLVAGLMFVGAALASGATDTSTGATDEWVMADTADDCDNDPGFADALPVMPDGVLPSSSSDDQACRDCHTNQEMLEKLAVEEEEAESLSEGPG